jgi:hypothetical protein
MDRIARTGFDLSILFLVLGLIISPTVAGFVDGVAIIVPTGMRRGLLKNLVQDLDARKNLGAILID